MDKTDDLIVRAEEIERTISSAEEIEIENYEGDIWISRYLESRGSAEGIEKFCTADEIDTELLMKKCSGKGYFFVL